VSKCGWQSAVRNADEADGAAKALVCGTTRCIVSDARLAVTRDSA
jgi:hypothetical protein